MKRGTLIFGSAASAALLGAALAVPARAGDGTPPSRQPTRVELGRRLFFDPVVSHGGQFSCASCHNPAHGFSDGRRFSVDENGATLRHSQSVLNLPDQGPLHWDGEFNNLTELLTARLAPLSEVTVQTRKLLQDRFETSRKLGLDPSRSELQQRLQRLAPPYYGPVTPTTPPLPPITLRLEQDHRYDRGFRAAFGSATPSTEHIVAAMRAYLLSLRSGESAYDRYVAGDPDALGAAARRGLTLFAGKANCSACHAMEEGGKSPFTDHSFHDTGVAFRTTTDDPQPGITRDRGRETKTFVRLDLGRFKTPSLRDVALRAPYMHDGSFPTLLSVVDYYNGGGTPHASLDTRVHPLHLTPAECKDLVAFLRSLTSDVRPGAGRPSPARPAVTRLRLLDLHGVPVSGLAVTVVPEGDRLLGALETPRPLHVVSGAAGYVSFPFPPTTHVHLVAKGVEIGLDRLVPDSADRLTFLVTPRSEVSLRLHMGDRFGMPQVLTVQAARGQTRVLATFELLRCLSRKEGLYVSKDLHAHDSELVRLTWKGRGAPRVGPFEMDLSGGATEPIDLRAAPLVTRSPTITPTIAGASRGQRTSALAASE